MVKSVKFIIYILCFGLLFCGCNKQGEPKQYAGEPTSASEEYHIGYDLDGGLNNKDNPTTYTEADLPLTIKEPSKGGLVFAGWVSEELGVDVPCKSVEISVDTKDYIILTAVFREPTFDFAELPEDDFPRGVWTVNQLNEKYGEPKDVRIQYLERYLRAMVWMDYDDISIVSGYEDPSKFSFYEENIEGWDFDFSEEDKDVTFNIFSVTRRNDDATLPRDIKIGASAKEQIIASYPEGAACSSQWENINSVTVSYRFVDEKGDMLASFGTSAGVLEYRFDENDMLEEVEAKYWYMDG